MLKLFKGNGGNTFYQLADKLIRMGAAFVFGVLIARYLGVDDFGRLSFAQSFIGLIAVFSTLGLEAITIREVVSKPTNAQAIIGSVIAIRCISSLVSVGIMALLIFCFVDDYGVRLCIFLFSISFFVDVLSVFNWYFLSNSKGWAIAVAGGAAVFASSIFKCYLIFSGKSFVYFSLPLMIECFVSGAILLFLFMQKVRLTSLMFDGRLASRMLNSAWPLVMSAIMISVYMKVDQLMIQAMLSYADLGIYSVAVRLTEAWYFFPSVIMSALFPAVLGAKLISEDEFNNKMQSIYNFLALFALVISVAISLFSDQIVLLLYGVEYIGSSAVLTVYALTTVFVYLGIANGRWLVAQGMERFALFRTGIGLVINIGLNTFLIPLWGIKGAAIATLVSQFFASYFVFLFVPQLRKVFMMQTRALFQIDLIKLIYSRCVPLGGYR
ncbi:flippase [Marinagarivorans cellulosilyticus]|uniref:Flippase n=1 Tax=Marinagarivorans cellulosilyticus TaxID=2721545 RepID=A0AAN1WIR3_9GAMM|nr:flippase [Marinagarivorans cellulosilyticus]BCD98324.1 hypothetical protein MARGE09_P2525 [Marinagarivorans cellulosilyticus]